MLGIIVLNVNMVASFAPGNLVQVTWTVDSNDFMVGTINAVNSAALTITVDVTSISGPTGIDWTPWSVTLLAVNASASSTGINAASSSFSSFSPLIALIMMGMSVCFLLGGVAVV